MTQRWRSVVIIKFPGITKDEAESIAEALREATGKMGIAVFVTNVDVGTMSRREFLAAAKSIRGKGKGAA